MFVPDEKENELYSTIREHTENDTNRYYLNSSGNSAKSFAVLRAGLECTNFVSGDVDYFDFQRILLIAGMHDGDSFYDLGCGSGNCLLAAALLGIFKFPDQKYSKVVGIELKNSKVVECQLMLPRIFEFCHDHLSKLPTIQIIEENFLSVDWSDGDVVYSCATVYSASQMQSLTEKLLLLKRGARVILLVDKQFPPDQTASCEGADGGFWLAHTVTDITTSWGKGVAYIYRKL